MRTCFLISILFFCVLQKTSAQNRAAFLNTFGQYYTCGEIKVTGTKLTVEALIKLNESGTYNRGHPTYDDIVSKHNNPTDVNYLLRPDHCEITTSNGFYSTKSGYPGFSRDSFYHVAMTYDGAMLKFYVNGCVYDQVAATGNLFDNNYITTIGQLAANPGVIDYEQCYGFIDEVRIWSSVRAEDEIKYNILDLSNPTTQSGLLAYYKFEGNTKNVQGNSTHDAVPVNGPTIQLQNFTAVKPFSASTTSQQPSCTGNDGKLIITAIGGKAPYQYSLDGVNFQSGNTFNNLKGGDYTTYVKSDGIGCSKVEKLTLVNHPLTMKVDLMNQVKCFGGTDGKIKLSGTDNNFTYLYNFNNKGFQTTNTFENLMAGTYTVSIKNNIGCVKDTSLTITQPTVLEASAITNPDTCTAKKGNIALSVNGGSQPYSYMWSSGSNQPSVNHLLAGNYSVDITDKNGCKLSKNFALPNTTPKLIINVDPQAKSICAGDAVLLKASGGDTYNWLPHDNGSNASSATFNVFPSVTTKYKVVVRNSACNVEDSAFTTIIVNQVPHIAITKSNDIDCSSNEAQLFANGAATYDWQNSGTLSDLHLPNPIATPLQTTTYFVTAHSAEGCTVNDSITVRVLAKPTYKFDIPSAFTPNNDGKNDCFGVKYFGNTKEFSMNIYNRWGERIYSSTTISDCWNGSYRNAEQPSGVYIYIIKAKSLCGDVNKKGIVTLIR